MQVAFTSCELAAARRVAQALKILFPQLDKDIGDGVVPGCAERSHPHVLNCGGNITIVAAIRDPLLERLVRQRGRLCLCVQVIDVETAGHSFCWQNISNVRFIQPAELCVLHVHGLFSTTLAPMPAFGQAAEQRYHEMSAHTQIFNVMIPLSRCYAIAAK